MSDYERREEYFRAFVAAMDWRAADLGPVVNAAMDVADDEQTELRGWLAAARVLNSKQSRENAALREDNQALNDELTEYEKANNILRSRLHDRGRVLDTMNKHVNELEVGVDRLTSMLEDYKYTATKRFEEIQALRKQLQETRDLLARTERDLEAVYRSQS